jgi:hypothetical protein
MLMLDEGLAKVTTELDLKDIRLTVRLKVQIAISGRVDVENDRRPLEPFFWTLLPNFPRRLFCCARAAAISWTSRTM